jgi:hypothetical protein
LAWGLAFSCPARALKRFLKFTVPLRLSPRRVSLVDAIFGLAHAHSEVSPNPIAKFFVGELASSFQQHFADGS